MNDVSALEAIVLGVVQGLTEFIPVSSSGHLVLLPAVLGWPQPGLAFAVAVHVGTLVAVVCYYWRDWCRMLSAAVGGMRRSHSCGGRDAHILAMILVGTVPAALVGLTLAEPVEQLFNSVALVAVALLLTGVVLLGAGRAADGGVSGDVTLGQAIVIGCAQAVAVIPGISRSGATIAAGLFGGLQRDWAARFAFLLSMPVIAGAGAKEALDLLSAGVASRELCLLAYGAVASAITGLLAIHAVVRLVHQRKLWVFGVYCLAVGTAALAAYLRGVIG